MASLGLLSMTIERIPQQGEQIHDDAVDAARLLCQGVIFSDQALSVQAGTRKQSIGFLGMDQGGLGEASIEIIQGLIEELTARQHLSRFDLADRRVSLHQLGKGEGCLEPGGGMHLPRFTRLVDGIQLLREQSQIMSVRIGKGLHLSQVVLGHLLQLLAVEGVILPGKLGEIVGELLRLLGQGSLGVTFQAGKGSIDLGQGADQLLVVLLALLLDLLHL